MKVKCENSNCGWKGEDTELLHAPNPFDPEDELTGCPGCKDVSSVKTCCDEPGCWDWWSCGTPTPEGYRGTCDKHRPIH